MHITCSHCGTRTQKLLRAATYCKDCGRLLWVGNAAAKG
jgi:RNase P subunit RPR2